MAGFISPQLSRSTKMASGRSLNKKGKVLWRNHDLAQLEDAR